MKTGIQLPKFGTGLFSSILLLALLFNSCQGDPVELPDDDVFTKEKREQLGKMLLNDILISNDFVPQIPPYDTTVYWYVQTLYTQATSVMQIDSQSPSDNRWKGGWEIFIIDNDDLKHTFLLPGGDIFIHGGPNLFADQDKADWTAGCISVTNAEMEEIFDIVPIGIPIWIQA